MKKKILYLGLELPEDSEETSWIHFPLIKVTPYSPFSYDIENAFSNIDLATHIILTSKMAVLFFFEILKKKEFSFSSIQEKKFIAIGKVTKEKILQYVKPINIAVAEEETTDGIIELIDKINLKNLIFFWPHSKLSSNKIIDFINSNKNLVSRIISCPIYTTTFFKNEDELPINEVDGLFFSSPSTVNAYLHFYGIPPDNLTLYTQGKVTRDHLFKILKTTACSKVPIKIS